MAVTQVACAYCKKRFMKDNREVNRAARSGMQHFCTRSCAAAFGADRKRSKEVQLICACGNPFRSTTSVRSRTHCSRACATRFSATEEQRAAQRRAGYKMAGNLLRTSEVLQRREAWKYVELKLVLGEREHAFEFELNGSVFDLAMLDTRVLVEFDGPYHRGASQLASDARKNRIAELHGFRIERRRVPSNQVIAATTIQKL